MPGKSSRGRTENTRRRDRPATASNSVGNALEYAVRQQVERDVHTAALVTTGAGGCRADAAAGNVDVTPQVQGRDNYGNAIPQATASGAPVMRLQGGKSGISIPIQAGDQGVVVYLKHDSSAVGKGSTDPVMAASGRTFSEANPVYLGSVNGGPMENTIEFEDSGKLNIRGTQDFFIKSAGAITIECAGTLTIKAGAVVIESGGVSATGGDFSSNGKVLETHTHTGDSGGTTGMPN